MCRCNNLPIDKLADCHITQLFIMLEKLKEKVGIDFAWIEITDTCNLKCIHCYDQAVYKKGKIMTYTDFCHIIGFVK